MEQTSSPSALTVKNVRRIKTIDDSNDDDGAEISSVNGHRQRHSDRHHHHNRHSHGNHHHHRHHHHRTHHHRRHESHSPCSICSRSEFYSDVGYDPHQHHHHIAPIHTFIPPHTSTVHTHSPTKIYRDSGVVTDPERKTTKDTSVTADLEDVSSMFY